MGLIDANPSSIAGVTTIMEHLQQFVPEDHNGLPMTMACHGDGLSIERMWDAQRCRAGSLTPLEKLQGLEGVPQEFHKRGILLQV